jgi:myo-inositol-1-phosphate synthase
MELLGEMKSTVPTEISPSIIYATSAALEGCTFVNGGSQNTLFGPALDQLFDCEYRKTMPHDDMPIATNPAYLLGTDFKAGQTKFKTSALEYLRALGLTPRVIASSNHLGNNDMLNLTSKTTLDAKMRVKHCIFEPWKEEQLDHQVKVMYVPFMGDEKRDIVEYTSTGFMHSEHVMLTYTRAMDSVLCVPLMIDAA